MFTECSLNVHWVFTECSLNVPWMFTESPIDYYDGGTVRLNTEFYSRDTSFGLVNPRLRYSCLQVVFCVNLGTFLKCFLQLGWRLTGVRSTRTECSLNVPWLCTERSLIVPWLQNGQGRPEKAFLLMDVNEADRQADRTADQRMPRYL